jgi:predicted ATPase
MNNKLVVNFFGAPGAGKTVAATSLFAELKKRHLNVVLISEFAHQVAVEENRTAFTNQLYIWANQQYRIHCGYRHADIVITDSPILLGCVYNSDELLHQVIEREHRKYQNFNILLEMHPEYPYSMVGRVHSFEEAVHIEERIKILLGRLHLKYITYGEYTQMEIADLITNVLA